MSSEIAIDVRGLGKSYPMYARPHHRLLELLLGGPLAGRAEAVAAVIGVDPVADARRFHVSPHGVTLVSAEMLARRVLDTHVA